MASDAESWSFKRMKQDDSEGDGKHFVVMSRVHADPSDFEASTLDVIVSSGQKSWTGKGLKKPKTTHAHALQRICTALSQEGSTETAFKVVLTEQPDSLQVVCQWKEEGHTMFFKHPPLVLARDKEDSSERQVFDTLLSKCEALQERCQNSVARCTAFKQEAEQSQGQVQQFVNKQADRNEQMYIKFAAILNQKKKRILELEAELKELRATAEQPGNADNAGSGYTTEESGKNEEDGNVSEIDKGDNDSEMKEARSAAPEAAPEANLMDLETEAIPEAGGGAEEAEAVSLQAESKLRALAKRRKR